MADLHRIPTAFQYRKAVDPACSCRRPGESWAQTLKALGPDDTVGPGDVVVTEQNAKQLSQPRIAPMASQSGPNSVLQHPHRQLQLRPRIPPAAEGA